MLRLSISLSPTRILSRLRWSRPEIVTVLASAMAIAGTAITVIKPPINFSFIFSSLPS
jgi:hypothetical protein